LTRVGTSVFWYAKVDQKNLNFPPKRESVVNLEVSTPNVLGIPQPRKQNSIENETSATIPLRNPNRMRSMYFHKC